MGVGVRGIFLSSNETDQTHPNLHPHTRATTNQTGTNTSEVLYPLSLGRPSFTPTQTGLCSFGWIWSSLEALWKLKIPWELFLIIQIFWCNLVPSRFSGKMGFSQEPLNGSCLQETMGVTSSLLRQIQYWRNPQNAYFWTTEFWKREDFQRLAVGASFLMPLSVYLGEPKSVPRADLYPHVYPKDPVTLRILRT